jgi:sulfate adenylyltransferase subunit 2
MRGLRVRGPEVPRFEGVDGGTRAVGTQPRAEVEAGFGIRATAAEPAPLDPGDLLLVANGRGRISQVGMPLGGMRLVHATPPEVTVGSLDPGNADHATVAALCARQLRRPLTGACADRRAARIGGAGAGEPRRDPDRPDRDDRGRGDGKDFGEDVHRNAAGLAEGRAPGAALCAGIPAMEPAGPRRLACPGPRPVRPCRRPHRGFRPRCGAQPRSPGKTAHLHTRIEIAADGSVAQDGAPLAPCTPSEPMSSYTVSNLVHLEAESIFVLREVAAQFENPCLLFSGGKDSICVAHLARKAFWPARIPFRFVHVDTGHNFPETLAFRDTFVERLGVELVIGSVQKSIDRGRVREETGPSASRNSLQTVTLLDTLAEHRFDAAIGGARRDEEKARAKERVFSHRDEFGQWDPKNQRPELWSLFDGRKLPGEHFRVFPLSNWTELDVWRYIASEAIELPSLYFAHRREVFERGGMLLARTPFLTPRDGEPVATRTVRFRTIGDATCTGAVESSAADLPAIIAEVAATRVTERGTRSDDRRSETSMEDRKREGYF